MTALFEGRLWIDAVEDDVSPSVPDSALAVVALGEL
jgi:hypothetical protein